MIQPTDQVVRAFLQRPSVTAAMAAPRSTLSVLSFWFGCDITDPASRAALNGPSLTQLLPLWFTGSESMDQGCRAFAGVLHELRAGGLTEPEWVDTTEGKLARMLLADQFSRNAFRGTPEAYGYDDIAIRLSQELVGPGEIGGTLALPAALLLFVGVPLLHSEVLDDHDKGVELNAKQQTAYPEIGVFKGQKGMIDSHRDVIVRFGRYPHRNLQCGRETTPEEQVWLDDAENRPSWSKST